MCNTQTYYSGTKRLSLTHTCHTTHKGKMILPMGACPHRYYRSPLCVWCGTCVLASGTLYVNNMSVYCTYIHTLHMSSAWTIVAEKYDFWVNSGWKIDCRSIQKRSKNDLQKTSFYHKSFSFDTRGFQKIRFSIFWCAILIHFCYLIDNFVRPRDPSKKFRHVVRINLVQFSAPELH